MKYLFNKAVLSCGFWAVVWAAAAAAESQTYTFDIPRESLAQALREYVHTSGRQIGFTDDLVAGREAPALRGSYSADEALTRLLAGSNLVVERASAGELVIQRNSPPPSEKHGIEEIVVSATRRETVLEETPISIAALSAADIEKNRVVNMSDVTRLTPSLIYIPRGASEGYLSLRGAIVFDDSTGTDPAVSMFVDDVVRVSVADVQPELFDMDRVEVLKGPQGTLFGRNSIGGVVSLYTKQPTFKTEGSTELTYGEHNLVEVKGMFNTPLIEDRLAARVVFSGATVGGNVRDITTGAELNGEHRWAARAKLLYTPRDDLKIATSFDFLDKRGSDYTWIVGNFRPTLVTGLTYDPEQTSQLTSGVDYQRNWGFTGRADWTTDIGTFTSITGYRHLNSYNLTVSEPAPIDLSSISAPRKLPPILKPISSRFKPARIALSVLRSERTFECRDDASQKTTGGSTNWACMCSALLRYDPDDRYATEFYRILMQAPGRPVSVSR
jgi:outer membrane receptor protein involved in Fe transport